MGSLRVDLDHDDVGVVVKVAGELDPQTSPLLDRAVQRVLLSGYPSVVLDLRDVDFVDSAGLRVLVGSHTELSRHHRRLCLRAPSPPVRRVLDLTGLTDVLEIVE
jgi:anti-anti-sigma factor